MPTPSGPAATDLRIYPRQLQLDIDGSNSPVKTKTAGPDDTVPTSGTSHRQSGTGETDNIPATGIPARLAGKIDIGELVQLAQQCAADENRRTGHASQHLARDSNRKAAITTQRTPKHVRPGRKGNGIDHYLLWADRYANTVAAGARHPIAALAAEYGEDRNYVRDTIADARRRHRLLTDQGQGRAGGQLTKKARNLMTERQGDTEG
jgi:hypothetical protein